MASENGFLLRQTRESSSVFRSCLPYRLLKEIPYFLKTHLKRTNIKLLLLFSVIIIVYSILAKTPSTIENKPLVELKRPDRTKSNAFIITHDCNSIRFNLTKLSIEIAFPNFFSIVCYRYVPLTDLRIDTIPIVDLKKASSNLLTFVDLWTQEIYEKSGTNEYEWSFIFEDDVNFINASLVALPNFIAPLQELMNNPVIQQKHGFLYLGICGPTFDNDTQPLISKNTEGKLISQKGCGFCRHATGITAKRAEVLWGEISSYRPTPGGFIDKILYDYCLRSRNHFYTFGTNFHFPPSTGHMGIAYQDVGRISLITA